jgi:cytochrome c553
VTADNIDSGVSDSPSHTSRTRPDANLQKEASMRGVHIFVLAALVGAAPVTLGQSPSQPHPGRLLASNCFQCHGTNGRAVGEMEQLAGEDAADIYEKLLEMRGKPIGANVMHVQARGYTDVQLRLIADFFSTQRD